jgi:hypothetical protein
VDRSEQIVQLYKWRYDRLAPALSSDYIYTIGWQTRLKNAIVTSHPDKSNHQGFKHSKDSFVAVVVFLPYFPLLTHADRHISVVKSTSMRAFSSKDKMTLIMIKSASVRAFISLSASKS